MDGFDEPYWNLLQVLAWVWLGDRSVVSQASARTKERGTCFEELRVPGEEVQIQEVRGVPFTHLTLCLFGAEKNAANHIDDAEKEVLHALQKGELEAFGLASAQGDLVPVPQLEWSRLKFRHPLNGPPYAAVGFYQSGTEWHDLKFQRSRVMALWPDPLDTATMYGSALLKRGPGAPSTKRAAAKAAMCKRWPTGVPCELSNAAVAAQVIEDLDKAGGPSISPRTVDEARRELSDDPQK